METKRKVFVGLVLMMLITVAWFTVSNNRYEDADQLPNVFSEYMDLQEGAVTFWFKTDPYHSAQVGVNYPNGSIQADMPETERPEKIRAVFPIADGMLAAAIKQEEGLDTLVVFSNQQAYFYEDVLAFDTDKNCLVSLVESNGNQSELVFYSLDNEAKSRVVLQGLPAGFAREPRIHSAGFDGLNFRLNTDFGHFSVPVPSPI